VAAHKLERGAKMSQSNLDRDFLDWNADLLGNWGPNIDAFSICFYADHQRILDADFTAVTFGLIFPPSRDGIYAEPAPFRPSAAVPTQISECIEPLLRATSPRYHAVASPPAAGFSSSSSSAR
jgi:hypothetical protein